MAVLPILFLTGALRCQRPRSNQAFRLSMRADFWHERWHNRQIGFHRNDFHPYLTQFWPTLVLPAGSRVLVPLCGKSRDLLWLRAQGHQVVGVELSALAVREFFAENGLEFSMQPHPRFEVYACDGITLYCGDFFDLSVAEVGEVRAVYDRAALIALPPDMRQRYAAHLLQLLAPGSQALVIGFEYPQQQMDGPPFSVEAPEVEALFAGDCQLEQLLDADILAQEPRFRDRGVTRLHETVYRLQRR